MIQELYNKINKKNINTILEKKDLSFFYIKLFIREQINNLSIVDNNLCIIPGLNLKLYNKVGYSYYGKKINFSNIFYKNLTFKWFSPITNIKHNFNKFKTELNKKNYILFIKPIKSGVKCYSCGFKGLIKKKQ